MESIQVWHPMLCGCVVHEAIDTALGSPEAIVASIRYVTREEAVQIHRAHFEAAPGTTRDPVSAPQPPHKHCPRHVKHGATAFLHAALRDESMRVEAMRAEAAAISGRPVSEIEYRPTWNDTNPAGTHAPLAIRFPDLTAQQRGLVAASIARRRAEHGFAGDVIVANE